MKKTFIVFVLSLLTFLLLVSGHALPISMQTAKATSEFNAWGGVYNTATLPPNEISDESWICNFACGRATQSLGWTAIDNYLNQLPGTNWPSLSATLTYTQQNQIWDNTLWVGDYDAFAPAVDGTYHEGFCSQYGFNNGIIQDYQIYNITSSYPKSYQASVFDWTCVCAGLLFNDTAPYPTYPQNYIYNMDNYLTGPSNPFNDYGFLNPNDNLAVGMPYAWTDKLAYNGLSTSGYDNPDSGPYSYIGWQGPSPYLSNQAPYSSSPNWWFLYYYYEDLFANHSPHDSLDFAANQLYGSGNFESSAYNYGFPNGQNLAYLWSKIQTLGNLDTVFIPQTTASSDGGSTISPGGTTNVAYDGSQT